MERHNGRTNKTDLVELTAEIISAYVSNNTVVAADLPAIIGDVHEALSKASQRIGQTEREELRPAVTVKKSVTPDYIVCLEDGKKFKSLKRHLRTHYNLSPEEYREKWGLPHDYPMVAPNYAAARSAARQADGPWYAPREIALADLPAPIAVLSYYPFRLRSQSEQLCPVQPQQLDMAGQVIRPMTWAARSAAGRPCAAWQLCGGAPARFRLPAHAAKAVADDQARSGGRCPRSAAAVL